MDKVYSYLGNDPEGDVLYYLLEGMMQLMPTQRITPHHGLGWISDMMTWKSFNRLGNWFLNEDEVVKTWLFF